MSGLHSISRNLSLLNLLDQFVGCEKGNVRFVHLHFNSQRDGTEFGWQRLEEDQS